MYAYAYLCAGIPKLAQYGALEAEDRVGSLKAITSYSIIRSEDSEKKTAKGVARKVNPTASHTSRCTVTTMKWGFLSSFHILDLRPDNGGVKNSLPEG